MISITDVNTIEEFPLKPLTDGVDKVLQGVKEWQQLFEEAFDRLRVNGRRRDPLKNLCRADSELTKLIELTTDREQRFADLIVEAFELQKIEVDKYFKSLPYRTRSVDQEYDVIINELNVKQGDLKKNVVDRMAGNRAWMQSMLETVREEKRAWENAMIRQQREE